MLMVRYRQLFNSIITDMVVVLFTFAAINAQTLFYEIKHVKETLFQDLRAICSTETKADMNL